MKLAWLVAVLWILGCKHDKAPAPAPGSASAAPVAAPAAPPTAKEAMAAYEAKDYGRCATMFLAIGDLDALYNAACCQAQGGQQDAAFASLEKVMAGGYRNVKHLQTDTDLTSLHADPRWAKVVAAAEANVAKYEASVKEPALRREILAMRDEDQAARQAMIANEKDPEVLAKLTAIDRQTTARMKEIVAKYGWPGNSLIGSDAAMAAWLLVQHADKDVAFQKHCLGLLEKAVQAKEARGVDYAYLYDRVAVAENRPQRYGTQFKDQRPQPIEDEANVDARRKEIGLGTMAEYAKDMEKMYGKPFSPTTK